MKKFVLCFVILIFSTALKAQTLTSYLIKFKNKASTPYSLTNPLLYLSQRSIDRRTRYGLSIDSTDLPVPTSYLDSVRLAGTVNILNASRWLNQISIQTTDSLALTKIAAFPFVQSTVAIAARRKPGYGREKVTTTTAKSTGINNTTADAFNYGASYAQIHIHNGEFLHNIGLRGNNMIIGILDAGFQKYTSLKSFDSVNINGQVLGIYDFVAKDQSVVEDDAHGMECFSIIAANIPGQFIGTAPKANFYLFRSENVASEYPIEEHNWVCAAEKVDSAGGDVITSSLGYSDGMSNPQFDHTYAQMDGNTTIAARGADLGAKKGLLIVMAMGNQGNDPFHFLSTPSDADSVMAVGAVSTSGGVASFSSYGPSADGQVKPDVASVGVSTVLQNTNNTIGVGDGTSFATPNIAGLATCLWQGFQEFSNMKIIQALRQSGSKAQAPDNRVGYGIPDIKKATLSLLKDYSTASGSTADTCKKIITWTSKDMSSMKYEVERKAFGETSFTKVGERASTRSSFGPQTYSYTDSLLNVQAGAIIYRIRQLIDTARANLSADYIDTVNLTQTTACITTGTTTVIPGTEEIVLVPNPANNLATLKITTSYPIQKLLIRIVNGKGQVVWTNTFNKPTGTNSYALPISYLAKGNYYVELYDNKKRLSTQKLIKL